MTDTTVGTPPGDPHRDRLRGVHRRDLAKRAAAVGLIAWTAPVVSSVMTPAGAIGSCDCTSAPVQIVNVCQLNANQVGTGCQVKFSATVSVCRSTPTQTMLFSRVAAGTQEPYFDELAVLTVTPPTGPAVVRNFIRWQNNCRDVTGANVTLTSVNQCGATAVAAVDITAMFGTTCGTYSVSIEVRNFSNPYGWSTAWIVPV